MAMLALVAVLGSGACEGWSRGGDQAEPTLPGAPVGATGADATAAPDPTDSTATHRAHP